MTTEISGYWGPHTSTVDWCETNYQHVYYVSELFNSVSSLAMVLVGVLGIVLHRQVLERRFTVAFALVSVVGLGSIAFHSTLRFEHQMMDELPMLYLASVIAYILLENRPERRFGVWLPLGLIAYALVATALTAGMRGKLQFYMFHASFVTLELFALVSTYLIHRRSTDVRGRRIFRIGMSSYAIAIVSWRSDIAFCSSLNETLPSMGIPNPQLHAWWHVLVSIGFYTLLLVIAHNRLRILGKAPEFRFAAGFIPFVRPTAP
jgi:dihydroceramidase